MSLEKWPGQLLAEGSPLLEAEYLELRHSLPYGASALPLRSYETFGTLVLPVFHPDCFESWLDRFHVLL